jgi:hypothetical protein
LHGNRRRPQQWVRCRGQFDSLNVGLVMASKVGGFVSQQDCALVGRQSAEHGG